MQFPEIPGGAGGSSLGGSVHLVNPTFEFWPVWIDCAPSICLSKFELTLQMPPPGSLP